MLKLSLYRGSEENPVAIPLFASAADAALEKTASSLLPDVVRYIENLRPRKDCSYVLVNAMGAGEYYGSNSNGDHFPEAGLIHRPDVWTGDPLIDKVRAKTWAYGYPTFYSAHPFAHHRNKDPLRAFGEVELAVWHEGMKRVELVCRVEKEKCEKFGGVQVWDKLQAGRFIDVSMGARVKFDTCSICLDWEKYAVARATFDPKIHKSPDAAILAYHLKSPIRGLSRTRKDYCEHARKMMNRILPDGRKVFVYNDYPNFFDISFVFIGADKTAKVMAFMSGGQEKLGGAELAEKLGYVEEEGTEKTASATEEDGEYTSIFGKGAAFKRAEILKDVVPDQFAEGAAISVSKSDRDLPDDLLNLLSDSPLRSALSTSGALGVVLRPREFQRMSLRAIGKDDLADDLDRKGVVFPRTEERTPLGLGPDQFLPELLRALLPILLARSALAPAVERRVLMISLQPAEKMASHTSISSDVLRKISAAYNDYRSSLVDLVPHAQTLLGSAGSTAELQKWASVPVDQIFSSLSVAYIKTAFLDEVGKIDVGSLLIDAR